MKAYTVLIIFITIIIGYIAVGKIWYEKGRNDGIIIGTDNNILSPISERPPIEQARYEIVVSYQTDKGFVSEDLYTDKYEYDDSSSVVKFITAQSYWQCNNNYDIFGNFINHDYKWYLVERNLLLPSSGIPPKSVSVAGVYDRLTDTILYEFGNPMMITIK